MLAVRSVSSPLPRPRTSIALLAAVAILLAALAVGVGSASLVGAADGRTVAVTPTPERGYWLFGDTIEIRPECLDGESFRVEYDEELSSWGWGGSTGVGLDIDVSAPAGTHEVVVSCTFGGAVVDTFTVPVEVGAPLTLVATVGTVAGECASTTEITVDPGTEVYWCYTLVPHPELVEDDLTPGFTDEVVHTLSDSLNGPLGSVSLETLGPLGAGLSSLDLGIVSSTVADETLTNTGTWSTELIEIQVGDYDPEEDDSSTMPLLTASATVIVPSAPTPGDTPDAAGPDTTPAAPAAPAAAQPTYAG